MKELKALAFLKDVRQDTPVEWAELDKAIKELEELNNNNRSCESCERRKHCNIWAYAGVPIDSLKDFWCNGYEAKGE